MAGWQEGHGPQNPLLSRQRPVSYTRPDKIYEDTDMSVLHLLSLTTGRVLSFQSSVLNSDILKQLLKRTSSSINI